VGETTMARFWRRVPFDETEDPYAAPARYTGDDPAPRGTLRRAWQNSLWVYLAGLPFLLLSVPSILEGDPSTPVLVLRSGLVLAIGVAYVLAAWAADASLILRWAYVVGFVTLVGVGALTWQWDVVYYGVYVALLIVTLIPWRQARVAVLVWGALLVVLGAVSGEGSANVMALIGTVSGLALGGGIESSRISARLTRAEQRATALAVVAERERISRDLHDILGHSLTAISIKSELARRLVEADPRRAQEQIAEVEEIARQALGDVRATASAIREVRAATELASARSVLEAAGIEAHLPSALPRLSDPASELFGFVIREAVTNVVRHSEARTCTIAVTEDRVSVTDDGAGLAGGASGSGLVGLRRRVEAAGGRLEVDSARGQGTTVTAILTPDVDPRPADPDVSAVVR
jgi:two-component system, NarL family, sensor histidine kinase DesK